MALPALPGVADRFLRYVQIDTQSDPDSDTVPSTEKQLRFGELLADELRELGAADVEHDEHGYVYATIPPRGGPNRKAPNGPVLALLAHQDTSPDEPGDGVEPQVHEDYDGGAIDLRGDGSIVLDPEEDPALGEHVGHDLITTDGTTLLGSDDKAGVAIIMELAARLLDAQHGTNRERGADVVDGTDGTVEPNEEEIGSGDGPRPHPPIRICFTVDEEIGRGVDHLDPDRLGADLAYTLDGGGRDVLYTETFFAARARLTVEGEMVHPGYAKDRLVNALRIVAEFVGALPQAESPEHTEGREGYFYPHRSPAASAHRAAVDVLLRDFTADGLDRRRSLIERQADYLQSRYPDAGIELEIEDQYENMGVYIEELEPRVITVAQRAAERMGIELRLDHVRGGTDGSRLSARGLPTPNVFTGGHAFHSRKEWNTVQNLERALAFTEALVYAWGEEAT